MVVQTHCTCTDPCYHVFVVRYCKCRGVRHCQLEKHKWRVPRASRLPIGRCKGQWRHPDCWQDKRKRRICRLQDNCHSVVWGTKFRDPNQFLLRGNVVSKNRGDCCISLQFSWLPLQSYHGKPVRECDIQLPWKRKLVNIDSCNWISWQWKIQAKKKKKSDMLWNFFLNKL